jgi:hypothetical protein
MQELVAYFDRSGKLSPRQMRRLLDQGFLASDAPQTMVDLCDRVGAVYYFRVTGDTNGPLWGTDVYTGDSALAVAAAHAGLARPGATAILRVTVEPPLRRYQGDAQRRHEPRLRAVRHGLPSQPRITRRLRPVVAGR